MNVATSYPSDFWRWLSIFFSSVSASLAGESKMTFPLAMNVSTFESPSDANNLRRRSILTLWPPTLIARRKAINRVILVDGSFTKSLLTRLAQGAIRRTSQHYWLRYWSTVLWHVLL